MCCFCIDLRTGGIIIGGLWIFFGIINLLSGYYQSFVGSIMVITLASLWIYGVFKKQPMLMIPFIIVDGLLRILYIIVTFYELFGKRSQSDFIYYIIVDVICAILVVYMFVVLFSLYRKIVDENNSAQNQQIAYEAPTTQMQKAISEV